ncbi:MAG: hypothetical protein JSS32_06005 [Verrucomicrobia bacterium]|nr:hypothetical protein [Verrucomicrobiota bacterium]
MNALDSAKNYFAASILGGFASTAVVALSAAALEFVPILGQATVWGKRLGAFGFLTSSILGKYSVFHASRLPPAEAKDLFGKITKAARTMLIPVGVSLFLTKDDLFSHGLIFGTLASSAIIYIGAKNGFHKAVQAIPRQRFR